jgi:hypothetical protein
MQLRAAGHNLHRNQYPVKSGSGRKIEKIGKNRSGHGKNIMLRGVSRLAATSKSKR